MWLWSVFTYNLQVAMCHKKKKIRSKWHNSRSTKLSNLNVSCVVDTLCNVSFVSDTLWAVQECSVLGGDV